MGMLLNILDSFLWVDIVNIYLLFFKLSACILVTSQIKEKICVIVYSVHEGICMCIHCICLCKYYNN